MFVLIMESPNWVTNSNSSKSLDGISSRYKNLLMHELERIDFTNSLLSVIERKIQFLYYLNNNNILILIVK